MPSKSKAQANLMRAAEHGATFPLAQQVRQSMTLQELHDFASGPMKGKPVYVAKTAKAAQAKHPHANLGKYLHKAKGR